MTVTPPFLTPEGYRYFVEKLGPNWMQKVSITFRARVGRDEAVRIVTWLRANNFI